MQILQAYERMLPVLTAEESLLAATRTSVGAGVLKRSRRDSIVRGWVRAMRGPTSTVTRAKSPAQYEAAMGRAGLRVRRG